MQKISRSCVRKPHYTTKAPQRKTDDMQDVLLKENRPGLILQQNSFHWSSQTSARRALLWLTILLVPPGNEYGVDFLKTCPTCEQVAISSWPPHIHTYSTEAEIHMHLISRFFVIKRTVINCQAGGRCYRQQSNVEDHRQICRVNV